MRKIKHRIYRRMAYNFFRKSLNDCITVIQQENSVDIILNKKKLLELRKKYKV